MAGSSASEDGNHVFLGFKNAAGETFNIMVPHQAAIDLMMLNALAVGQAARNRNHDPTQNMPFL